MNNPSADSINPTTIHLALQHLLDDYLSEKAEGQKNSDTSYIGYWDSACRTIYEVAEALNIPFDDPWRDPSWVRTAEYQALRRTTRAEKRQSRQCQKEQVACMPSAYTLKQFLQDPLIDKGDGIQICAKRHARLLIQTNIWQRSSRWVGALLSDWSLRQWYAFQLYRRLVRRYGVVCPLPADGQVIDPMWWEVDPIVSAHVQETESQSLAKMLYIAAFSQELGRYSSDYMARHATRWNTQKAGH